MNSNYKSPTKEDVDIDNDLVQEQATSHSKERAFEEGGHESVCAEEVLPDDKEVDSKPPAEDSTSVINVTDQTIMRR
jgi:hypothetical protein